MKPRGSAAAPLRLAADSEWAAPSRRARALAAGLAVLLAALTGVLVSLAWKRVGPPRAAAVAIEVKLIAAPAPAGPVVRTPQRAGSSARR